MTATTGEILMKYWVRYKISLYGLIPNKDSKQEKKKQYACVCGWAPYASGGTVLEVTEKMKETLTLVDYRKEQTLKIKLKIRKTSLHLQIYICEWS